jgi:hypothetical protein
MTRARLAKLPLERVAVPHDPVRGRSHPGGEQLDAGLRDKHGVLELRAAGAVVGDCGPLVGPQHVAVGTCVCVRHVQVSNRGRESGALSCLVVYMTRVWQ